jgi:hypothetical protein
MPAGNEVGDCFSEAGITFGYRRGKALKLYNLFECNISIVSQISFSNA